MLRKRLKHDLIEQGGRVLTTAATLIIFGLVLQYVILTRSHDLWQAIGRFFAFFYPLFVVITLFQLIRNAFRSMRHLLFGPSAYLTFSLPMSTHTVILSKFISLILVLIPIPFLALLAFSIVSFENTSTIFSFTYLFQDGFNVGETPIEFWITFPIMVLLMVIYIVFTSMTNQAILNIYYKWRFKPLASVFIIFGLITVDMLYIGLMSTPMIWIQERVLSMAMVHFFENTILFLVFSIPIAILVMIKYGFLYYMIDRKIEINSHEN